MSSALDGYITRLPDDVFVKLYFPPLGLKHYVFGFQLAGENQLDYHLHSCDPSPSGPIGIIVNGQLYVDDRVFWLGLLKAGKIYRVAYNAHISRPHPLLDYLLRTPLYEPDDIPSPNPIWQGTNMRKRAMEAGLIERREAMPGSLSDFPPVWTVGKDQPARPLDWGNKSHDKWGAWVQKKREVRKWIVRGGLRLHLVELDGLGSEKM